MIIESFWEIIESFENFLRDYRENFEKLKREYMKRVKIFQGYLNFERSMYRDILRNYRVFVVFERLYREFWEIIERL